MYVVRWHIQRSWEESTARCLGRREPSHPPSLCFVTGIFYTSPQKNDHSASQQNSPCIDRIRNATIATKIFWIFFGGICKKVNYNDLMPNQRLIQKFNPFHRFVQEWRLLEISHVFKCFMSHMITTQSACGVYRRCLQTPSELQSVLYPIQPFWAKHFLRAKQQTIDQF